MNITICRFFSILSAAFVLMASGPGVARAYDAQAQNETGETAAPRQDENSALPAGAGPAPAGLQQGQSQKSSVVHAPVSNHYGVMSVGGIAPALPANVSAGIAVKVPQKAAPGLNAPAAGDTWLMPFQGVSYLHRKTKNPKWDIHVAVIDLSASGVRLAATAPKERRTTVSAFAKREGVQVAVNAGFFSFETYDTVGPAVGEGKPWPGIKDEALSGQLVFGEGNAEIIEPKEIIKPESWMHGMVSGHPLLVWDGKPVEQSKKSSLAQSRHPRTAVGLSRDRKKLFLMVVDGRQDCSVGMTAAEEAKVLRGLGAWYALNLDGGGSSAMYIKGRGIVNHPSDGKERVVANHLGVFAVKAPAAKAKAVNSKGI